MKGKNARDPSFSSLWKGIGPSLLLCSNPAINFTVFDSIKGSVLSRHRTTSSKKRLTLTESFLLGVLAKFVATMATYPLIRAKVLLMVTHRSSMLQTLLEEYNQQGISGLYKGCNLQLLHTLLKSAFLMMARERINDSTQRMILGTTQE